MAMSESGVVNLEVWKVQYVLITTRHGIKLFLLQVWCKGDCKVGIDVDQHQLAGKMVAKVFQVRQGGSNFCEVTDCHQSLDTERIGFKEDSLLLEPCKKVSVGASKFDIAKAAVRKDVTADAYLRLILMLDAGG